MSVKFFDSASGRMIITLANFYDYGGFVFEHHNYLGPVKLRRSDLEPAARTGAKFYKSHAEWSKLTEAQKEKTRYPSEL